MAGGKLKRAVEVLLPPMITPMCFRGSRLAASTGLRGGECSESHPPPHPYPRPALGRDPAPTCLLRDTRGCNEPGLPAFSPERARPQLKESHPLRGKEPHSRWQNPEGSRLRRLRGLRRTPPTLPGRQSPLGLLGNVVPASCPEKRRCVDPRAPKTPRPG